MNISASETNVNKDQKELLQKLLRKCKEDDIIGVTYIEENDKRNYAELKICINKKIFDTNLKKILT